MKTAIELIADERDRQLSEEGFDPLHDDAHWKGELAQAAIAYVVAAHDQVIGCKLPDGPPATWPWGDEWWKRSDDPVRNLVKAAALLAAEIDRVQRVKQRALQ